MDKVASFAGEWKNSAFVGGSEMEQKYKRLEACVGDMP